MNTDKIMETVLPQLEGKARTTIAKYTNQLRSNIKDLEIGFKKVERSLKENEALKKLTSPKFAWQNEG